MEIDIPEVCKSPLVNSAVFNVIRIMAPLSEASYYKIYKDYDETHKAKRSTFLDIYHILWYIGSIIKPKRILEIGTRVGGSICMLLSAYVDNSRVEKIVLCDTFDDSLASPIKVIEALKYLNLPCDKVRFIKGNSAVELPKLIGKEAFDYILVDGSHQQEIAWQDMENAHQLIEMGGCIVMDDIGEKGANQVWNWFKFRSKYVDSYDFSNDYTTKGVGIAWRK